MEPDSDRTACANCESAGTTKALIRNDEGNVCGVIYTCERTTCKDELRSIFTQDVQLVTLRLDQRGEAQK